MKKIILFILLMVCLIYPVSYSNANDIEDFFHCLWDPDDEDCSDSNGGSSIIKGGNSSTIGNKKNPYSGKYSINQGINDVGGKVNDIYKTGKATDHLQNIIIYLLRFLLLLVVLIIIYAGFLILTAAGDEEKVTKGKKIVIYAIMGLVVIYLAGPITDFILDMFEAGK